jgi:thiosulfate dehydrogenase [quinone] large subunit
MAKTTAPKRPPEPAPSPGAAGASSAIEDRIAAKIPAAMRILVGLMWLQNSGWKRPNEFPPLARQIQEGIDNPVFPPYSWALENVIQPNLTAFGWFTLLNEAALAAFLLLGLATRFWALLGAVMSLAIGLTVAYADNEWGWAYWLMIAAHLLLFATAAGRVWGLDGLLRPAWARSSGRVATLLGRFS